MNGQICDDVQSHTNMTAAARVQQFDARHEQDEPAVVLDDAWLLFADGARRELRNMFGLLEEPPPDETRPTIIYQRGPRWERLRRIAWYWEVRLKAAVMEFDRAKEAALANSSGWTQENAVVAKLQGLAGRVKELKAKLEEAKAARDAADPQKPKYSEADIIGMQRSAGKQADYAKMINEISV